MRQSSGRSSSRSLARSRQAQTSRKRHGSILDLSPRHSTHEEVLQALVDSFKLQREELGKTFSDDVLELDLEGLISRFENVHSGLREAEGRLSGGQEGHSDRFARRSLHAGGRNAPSPGIAWQKLKRELEDAEARHAADLGDSTVAKRATSGASNARSGSLDARSSSLVRALDLASHAAPACSRWPIGS